MSKKQVVSVSRDIAADAATIFALLRNPAKHSLIDGSGTVKGSRADDEVLLELGSRFSMSMVLGVPYMMTSEVVEYEENRRIAWAHFGGHRWRYDLEPIEGGTRVTESFDWGTAKFPPFYEWVNYPRRHVANMERTLERLGDVVTNKS